MRGFDIPFRGVLVVVAGFLFGGCHAWEVAASGAGVTAALGRSPSHEIDQIYYLGVFDPTEQLPPSLYRVTVRGQASFISAANFASGWVPAGMVDSLGTRIRFNEEGDLEFKSTDSLQQATLATGRRLMMFGPEGFRPAPADHRLVIIMGSNPSAYFQAVDQVLGEMAGAHRSAGATASGANQRVLEALLAVQSERKGLDEMLKKVPVPEAEGD